VKIQACLLAILAIIPHVTLAGSSAHEALIDQIEAHYTSSIILNADSPTVKLPVDRAVAANPGVDESTWQSVRAEAATALIKLFTAKGSLLDVQVRNATDSLNESELITLNGILDNPVFRKFQAAMASNSAQKQVFSDVMKAGLGMGPLINTILVNYHLIEVH
jgi:hypothetical protein